MKNINFANLKPTKATIHISGIKPLSKQHGTGRCGNKYFPKPEYKAFKDALAWEALTQLKNQGWKLIETGPVWMSVIFRADKNLGDISNLIGGIEDALEGIAYKNDCQVFLKRCRGVVFKNEPTNFTIELETTVQLVAYDAWVADGIKRRTKRVKKS